MRIGKSILWALLVTFFIGCSSPLESQALKNDRKKVTIYLVGDSTVADGAPELYPLTGWGQVIGQYFDSLVTVSNRAVSGKSTKSYISSGKWQAIVDTLRENDIVLIEFGHNDEKLENPNVGVSLEDYKKYLVRYVSDARSKRAIPVLLTPIARRSFTNGSYTETHGGYPDAMRSVSHDYNVPLIDMHKKSVNLLKAMGPDSSKALYNWVKPGEYASYPHGSKDNTHFCKNGAMKMAQLVTEGMLESKLISSEHILLAR